MWATWSLRKVVHISISRGIHHQAILVGCFYRKRFALSAISPDGQILAALTANEEGESTLRAWHLHDKREIYLEASELGLASTQELTISPTGNIILLTKGGTLLVWDATGHLKGILRDPDIKGFLLTPDGRYLLTHGLFKTPLKVWDILQA